MLLDERMSAIEAAIIESVALPKTEGGQALRKQRLIWATDPAWYGALKEDYPDALMVELELGFRSYMVCTKALVLICVINTLIHSAVIACLCPHLQERYMEKLAHDPKVKDEVRRLLDLALAFAVVEAPNKDARGAHPHSGRLPFVLLEDLVESQPLTIWKGRNSLWEWLEKSIEECTVEGVYARGKLILLRTCNSLLRRLSKTHDAELAGRVLYFIAASRSVTERSGVNVLGRRNTGNVTAFEHAEAFQKAEADEAARASADAATAAANPVDYALYSALWGLQKTVMSPETAQDSVADWRALMTDIDKVLSAFEGNPLQQDADSSSSSSGSSGAITTAAAAAATSSSATAVAATAEDDFFAPKYLTSSRLLLLQLRDPVLRQQVLTQLLVLVKWLASPTGAARRRSVSGTAAAAAVQTLAKAELPLLWKRLSALIESTPPGGKEYLRQVRFSLRVSVIVVMQYLILQHVKLLCSHSDGDHAKICPLSCY
jgi:THO complex subunit 1